MKKLALVLILLCMTGCATVSPERVADIWRDVTTEYSNQNVAMPEVIWVDKDIYLSRPDGEVFCKGAYNRVTKKVYLRRWWADEDTVAHEFRHAYGDRQGERYGRMVLKD